jgi:hypothetical protein
MPRQVSLVLPLDGRNDLVAHQVARSSPPGVNAKNESNFQADKQPTPVLEC